MKNTISQNKLPNTEKRYKWLFALLLHYAVECFNTLCSRMFVFIVISCFLSSARYMRLSGKIVLGLLSTQTTTTRRRISTLLRNFKNIMHNEVLYILRFSLWQISPSRSKTSLWPTTQRRLQPNTRSLLLHFVSSHGNNLVF